MRILKFFFTRRELIPTLLLAREGLVESDDLVLIFCQNITINCLVDNPALAGE